MTGIELITDERQRQIEKEGFTAEHDKQYTDGQLIGAAMTYAMPSDLRYPINGIWPWTMEWFKPTPNNRIRELTKAGALIAAEIDRRIAEGEKP